MSDVKIKEPGPEIDSDLLCALESELGAKLPGDYRRFLLQNNGGDPEPGCFSSKTHDFLLWVDYFCQLDEYLTKPSDAAGPYTIAKKHELYGNIIPSNCLIIGVVCRDDLLLLRYAGSRCGEIHFKNMDELGFPSVDNPNWHGNPEKGVHYIAGSFCEFLGMLQSDAD